MLSSVDSGLPEWLGSPTLFGVEPVPGSVNRVKMILFFLKERRTGKGVVTYRFLLVELKYINYNKDANYLT